MADPTVTDTLKRFAARITTSKVKERQQILNDLLPVLTREDFSENAIKGILKVLLLTPDRYSDNKSRRAVEAVIAALAENHCNALCKHFISVTRSVADQQKRIAKTKSQSDVAFQVFSWSCLVIRKGLKTKEAMKEDQFSDLIELQSCLVHGAMATPRAKAADGIYNRLKRIWCEVPGSTGVYLDALTKADADIYKICMVSLLLRHLAQLKDEETVNKYKEAVFHMYAKQVIGSKTKVDKHVLLCCQDLLKKLDHAAFKEVILPVVEKAMLRSPEIALASFVYMLGGVSIDLSQYAMDCGKHIATHLHNTEESQRELAIQGSLNLAKQCSDSGAVEKLAKHFFAVLNGSEGKLTIIEQRMGMLSGIGNLSFSTVSGLNSVQGLSSSVAEFFIPILQQEVTETTLIHCLKMFALWCQKFITEVPNKIIQWFKTGLGLKSSTSSVRNAYYHCMNAAFHGDTMIQCLDLVPMLLQTVEKAKKQPSQLQLVAEGLSATCLLLKVALADIHAESKIKPLWDVLLEPDKELFVNEKFLSTGSDEALQCVVILVERLVLDHPQRLTEKSARSFYKAFVYCLTHPSHKVRTRAKVGTRKIFSSLGGGKLAAEFLAQYRTILNEQTLVDRTLLSEEEEAKLDPRKVIQPKVLAEGLAVLSIIPNVDKREGELLAMETLRDAHHPCIVYYKSDMWLRLLAGLKVDVTSFVEDYADAIMTSIKNKDHIEQSEVNMLSTLAAVNPKVFLPKVLDHVSGCLKNPGFISVTKRDVSIMNCAEGELFDRSCIEGAGKVQDEFRNMKRESKAYSYKDQLAEIELKKELARKKGIKEEKPKLTKKQQEAMHEQLQKESAIRAKLKALDAILENSCLMIKACVNGDAEATRKHLPAILKLLIPLVRSPLAAPRVCDCYVALRETAFPYTRNRELAEEQESVEDLQLLPWHNTCPKLGSLIAYATLRSLGTQCDLDCEWTQEKLSHQVIRIVEQIHTQCVPGGGLGVAKKLPYPAPTFTYCFYLLQSVLQNARELVGGSEAIQMKALNIMSIHAEARSALDDPDADEFGPSLLPRVEMLGVLLQVVGTTVSRLQQCGATTLQEVCNCASGDQGCAAAEQAEIDLLLEAMLHPAARVREAALKGLLALTLVLPTPDDNYESGMNLMQRIWVAKFDVEELIKNLADQLWREVDFSLDPDLCTRVVGDVINNEEVIRSAAANALAAALADNKDYVAAVILQLLELYDEKSYIPPPILDNFGRVAGEQPLDNWPARSGIAVALGKLSTSMSQDDVEPLFEFFVEKGLADRHEVVRKDMLYAALSVITEHGKRNVGVLLPLFEDFLAKAPETASFDAVRQSVVILMGGLAKHLDTDDPKIKPIVGQLITTLSTPSQQVQEAVANCLPPLVPAIKSGAPELVQSLLTLLLESENYGERRGAAYGLAGLVKGLGILALKQLDIMSSLQEAIQNKKNPRHREGSLFAFEMLCTMLGRLFEPYVVHILPHLLLCFGDGNQYVREAADDTARAVMSKLSAHGVKLVLPSLLTALEEDSWRTKTGSVELLGAMAYCAPKQLSACLPSIVPKLTEVITDSHMKVQKAGAQALRQIGSVIKNPEIQSIVPILLDALQEPSKNTTVCLNTLLETNFVHFIDAPSLALIMPVVQRAFEDRSTETRKKAAQIIGNMYSLTDQKDLAPYLPSVLPGLKQSLLDPVPEVRAVSARALGAIVKGMGESGFEDLIPWLMETLASDRNTVDRSGAAQGLSEVVGGLGVQKLQKLMPDIISTAQRMDIAPYVRDGYIMTYIYLPGVFQDDFLPYISAIIPSILQALADESEYVRDTALRAGQRIVNLYADTAIELLLPELEAGLFDENWRIRYSSVQLLGDLLYRISGVSGKMSTQGVSEDDNFGTESSQAAILHVLGQDRRNRVLAGLYMGRSDTALMVRQAALHVWKVIVTHTPKTLREILSTLFSLLLGCLASTSYDKRQVAARTLGDVVKKLGEKVLPEIIPILERGLESERSDQRQGVCIGLSEIMSSTSKEHITIYSNSLIPTVKKALCDPLPEVREAAAVTFSNLHANIGPRALDDILPALLDRLDDPDMAEYALDGLQQVMAIRSRIVLPYLVPQLTAQPVNTRALSFLSAVAGEALTKHLPKILPALMSSLSEKLGSEEEEQELNYCQTVVLSVTDEQGIRIIVDELLSATRNADKDRRCAAVIILKSFCQMTKCDMSEFMSQLFRGIICLFSDSHTRVLEASWECLSAVTKRLDASEMLQHISNLRQAIRYAVSDLPPKQELPGFCLPKKGITPILPIFREGILNGPPEMKESAAIGLGEAIKRTSAEALKPSVVNITGPLIRILGDRFTYQVKVAVLDTLGLLLGKCGAMLKPFLPQLQTTFIKALNDPNRSVRLKAADALGKLIIIHTRVDPLFTELQTGVKNADDTGIRDTMLQALRGCLLGAGAKMNDNSRKQITAMLEEYLSVPEDTTRTTAAACLGAMATCINDEELYLLLNMQLLDNTSSVDWMLRHGRAVALSVALKEAGEKLTAPDWNDRVVKTALTVASADRVPLITNGLACVGYLLKFQAVNNMQLNTSLLGALAKGMKHDSNDVKILTANIICMLGTCVKDPLPMPVMKVLVPIVVGGAREKNTIVKSCSEVALVSVLRLKLGDAVVQSCLRELDAATKEALNEMLMKQLRKTATMSELVVDIDTTGLA